MIKLFPLTAICLFLSLMSFSQVFELELYSDTVVFGKPGSEKEIKGDLINYSESPIEITITRLENNIPANWTSNISTDLCLPHYLSVNKVTIAALSKQEFIFHFVTATDQNNQGNALLEFRNSIDSNLIYTYRFYCITDTAYVSVNELFVWNDNDFIAFPNPNQGQFYLRYHTKQAESITVVLIDNSGKEIGKEKSFTTIEGQNTIPLIYHAPKGNYFLKVISQKKIYIIPILIT
ncbi:MAG: T9SS type A sorting domain-containing protein [Bacteroidetes bacterium]|nr:T9SS type A sorting domain-containing protein [Bacteroidota bacterium]MBT4339607.1 T9SS type A sorting domain-containing protein [Bacteroidota bacterium]MBT4728632.1 T9SS type A sorting domain-containing protein [Bacteroidota bacterium]